LVWPTGARDDVIPFDEAADFIGEEVTVEGRIVRTHNSGSTVFLNFAPDFETFTAVIFSDDWVKFPTPPEKLFYGQLVRVAGVVELYEGAPEIIIREPWQIEVALTLGQPIVTTCDCAAITEAQAAPPENSPVVVATSATEADAFVPPGPATEEVAEAASSEPVIGWQEAAAYAGQTVTVEGHIVDTFNSGKVVFLNFAEDFRTTFKVAIFPDAWARFPGPPEDFYRDKTVRVTGQIKIYQNAPEIIVDQPDQIEILEN
jgi:DNA/RNA endonuclease YhcR with UshA esterase domain